MSPFLLQLIKLSYKLVYKSQDIILPIYFLILKIIDMYCIIHTIVL
jgi:hypothetical protein